MGGERACSGGAAAELVEAWNTGDPGGLVTCPPISTTRRRATVRTNYRRRPSTDLETASPGTVAPGHSMPHAPANPRSSRPGCGRPLNAMLGGRRTRRCPGYYGELGLLPSSEAGAHDGALLGSNAPQNRSIIDAPDVDVAVN
jgi:hypothetical protein